MFLGHYGIALAAKRVAPRTSLGTLAFAAQWLDELWPILLLLGLERVRIVPGLLPANALDFVSYPISHSLLTVVMWAVGIGAAYGTMRRDRRAGLVVGALVASHWVLDLLMHRPDLPLWPGSRVLLGLGAWRSVPLTLALELAVFGGGLAVYLRATRARDRVGSLALWALVAFMVLAFLGATFGEPPPSERALAIGALAIWLFVPWFWWIDQHRDLVAPDAGTETPSAASSRPRAATR